MSSSDLEVLDTNIVVLLSTPLTKININQTTFTSDELESRLRAPTIGQGLQVDAASGNVSATVNIESMRSQKSMRISASRIDVNDRSGEPDFDAEDLAQIISFIVRELDGEVGTVGANMDVAFEAPGGKNAAQTIAEALFQKRTDYIPEGMQSAGGTARLFLTQTDTIRYTIVIEPRFLDMQSTTIFMSSNVTLAVDTMPPVEQLADIARCNGDVLRHVSQSLFSAPW